MVNDYHNDGQLIDFMHITNCDGINSIINPSMLLYFYYIFTSHLLHIYYIFTILQKNVLCLLIGDIQKLPYSKYTND